MSIAEIGLPGFDYGALPAEVRIEAKAAAERIKERMRGAVVEVGADLIQVKARLPHGEFGKWLKAEFAMTERSAQNYMAAAEIASKCETVSVLKAKTLYLLAAPSTPEPARQEIVDRFVAGEVVSDRAVKDLIAEAKDQAWREQRRAKEAAREAKIPLRTRQSRAQREAKRQFEHQEWLRLRAEQEAATNRAAELIVAAIPSPTAPQIRDLLRNCATHKLVDALLAKLDDGAAP